LRALPGVTYCSLLSPGSGGEQDCGADTGVGLPAPAANQPSTQAQIRAELSCV
jgi:hypothetical protein